MAKNNDIYQVHHINNHRWCIGSAFQGFLSCVHFQICTNTMLTTTFATCLPFCCHFDLHVSFANSSNV
jgi:hypothetical protein